MMINGNKNNTPVSLADLESIIGNESLGAEKSPGLDTPCSIHIHSSRHRLADSDGISGKAAIDGLVHAGLLRDDSPKEVKKTEFTQEKIAKSEEEKTVITIKIV
jgi:hypothetical protein